MSNVQHPYDDEEIAYRRAWPSIHDIDSRNADMRNERDRWLATYDALSARVAKLEAEQSEARNRAARLEAALRNTVAALGAWTRPTDEGGVAILAQARAALEEPK